MKSNLFNEDEKALLNEFKSERYDKLENNEFKLITIFESHPAYGHTYFELADFNKDGESKSRLANLPIIQFKFHGNSHP